MPTAAKTVNDKMPDVGHTMLRLGASQHILFLAFRQGTALFVY